MTKIRVLRLIEYEGDEEAIMKNLSKTWVHSPTPRDLPGYTIREVLCQGERQNPDLVGPISVFYPRRDLK